MLIAFCPLYSMRSSTIPSLHLETVSAQTNLLQICSMIEHIKEFPMHCQSQDIVYAPQDFEEDLENYSPLIDIELVAELISKAITIISNRITSNNQQNQRLLNKLEKPSTGISAETIIVDPDAKIITIGDLHGNVHSLARIIKTIYQKNLINAQGFLAPNTYLIFTGDLGDRGHYSIETWYLALLLKCNNPNNVIILQGNHETKELALAYGITAEIIAKYTEQDKSLAGYVAYSSLLKIFNLLPQTCFIGTLGENNTIMFLQYVHAGLPDFIDQNNISFTIDFNALLTHACSSPTGQTISIYPTIPKHNGLIWNSFFSTEQTPYQTIIEGDRCEKKDKLFHGAAVLEYLKNHSLYNSYKLCGIIRGHDHMKHISQLCYNANPEISNITSMATAKNWHPVNNNIIPIIHNPNTQSFPVICISSLPNMFKHDNFAIFSFNKPSNAWFMYPFTQNILSLIKSQSFEIYNHKNIDTEELNALSNTPITIPIFNKITKSKQIALTIPQPNKCKRFSYKKLL